jgi:hypothetical protein
MKKALIILAVIISSCSNDSENRTEPQNCLCETIKQADTFTLPTGQIWTVVILENDCSGVQRQKDLSGTHSVGEKICN